MEGEDLRLARLSTIPPLKFELEYIFRYFSGQLARVTGPPPTRLS
jgi:hypothetical protein